MALDPARISATGDSAMLDVEANLHHDTQCGETGPIQGRPDHKDTVQGRVLRDEIPDSQEASTDDFLDCGPDGADPKEAASFIPRSNQEFIDDTDELSDEELYEEPQNHRQLKAFHFCTSFYGTSRQGNSSNRFDGKEIPDSQEDTPESVNQDEDIEYEDEALPDTTDPEERLEFQINPYHIISNDEIVDDLDASIDSVIDQHQNYQVDKGDDTTQSVNEEDQVDLISSFHTEATEVIPGGTQLTPRENPDLLWPLHQEGLNVNGCLPSEHPLYLGHDMDDAATQPATQAVYDNRRLGLNSELSKQDEADVILILRPASLPALASVDLTAEAATQHIHQNHDRSQVATNDDNTNEKTDLNKKSAKDIALRFSSRVHNTQMGFVFGRNVYHSDILLVPVERKEKVSTDSKKNYAVSNKHFRIFLNRHGIAMLEDTSTNGTVVERTVLHGAKAPNQTPDMQPRHTLHTGNMIEIPITNSGESIRFVVVEPKRIHNEAKYQENLRRHLALVEQAERKAAAVAQAQVGKKNVPSNLPDLTNALPDAQQEVGPQSTASMLPSSGGLSFGLAWNGGERFNVIRNIGQGAFATVAMVAEKRDGEVYAVKQLEKRKAFRNGVIDPKFYNELKVMQKIRHPHITEYKDHQDTDGYLYIIMEYMPNGDLRRWTDKDNAMTEYSAASVARQMIDALSFLHDMGITHRDVKPDNILVAGKDPEEMIFKLADFGLSKEVVENGSLLQTFCGTLLYLAPEVYPDFERARLGLPPTTKRTRSHFAAKPYEHSVDIWSLGVVIYQVLAGRPPFKASKHNEGPLFLQVVMNVPVDYERLTYIGISQQAIDFISQMIVVDRNHRATAAELKDDPWLIPKQIPAPDEGAAALDASQLSLADCIHDGDDLDDMEDSRNTKRARNMAWKSEDSEALEEAHDEGWLPGGLRRSYFEPSKSVAEWPLSNGPPPPQPLLPPTSFQGNAWEVPAASHRLFGEIGTSALGSSGVLGQNANLALEVTMGGTSDDEGESASDQGPSIHASAGSNGVNTSHPASTHQPNVKAPHIQPTPKVTSAAGSLLGAEALVGQLNMASPESGASTPAVNSNPPSLASTQNGGLNSSSKAAFEGTSTHQDELAAGAKSKQTSQGSSHHQDGQQVQNLGKTAASPATAFNSQDSVPKAAASNNGSKKAVQQSRENASAPGSIYPSVDLAPPPSATEDGFLKPLFRFGNLFLEKGSIKSVRQIKITSMGTSFGRNPKCTYTHPNIHDRRVSRTAFDIQMFYPGIYQDLLAGKTDWANNPGLTAVISTRTNTFITINDIRLKKGQGCWLFGKLRTGDVVSVVELPPGQKVVTEYDKEFLKFRCEFFIGASKTTRKPEEPFIVEREDEKYVKFYGDKNREGSGEAEGDGAATAAASMTEANTAANATTTVTAGPSSSKTPAATSTTNAPTSAPVGKTSKATISAPTTTTTTVPTKAPGKS